MELVWQALRHVLVAGVPTFALSVSASAQAISTIDAPDAFAEFVDPERKAVFQGVLAASGESSTDRLVVYTQVTGTNGQASDSTAEAPPGYRVFAVQDRGRPRGEEYPTYVFRAENDPAELELIFKTHAGPRLYNADSYGDTGCLFSAQKGYSDICLVDVQGNPAPDLPGLRNDFWSDLLNLLGL